MISNFTPEKARPLWERWARYEYHFGDFSATLKLEKRITEVYPNGWSPSSNTNELDTKANVIDPPIKLFAQRYTYLGIDAIAGRDLGFAQRGKQPPPTAPIPTAIQPPTAPAAEREGGRALDRAPVGPRRTSPEPRRRREPSPPPAKRFKPSSPPPPARRNDRAPPRERDRWDDGGVTPRRAASPAQPAKDAIPAPLIYFLSLLPSASAFDGKFMMNFMHLLRISTDRAFRPCFQDR